MLHVIHEEIRPGLCHIFHNKIIRIGKQTCDVGACLGNQVDFSVLKGHLQGILIVKDPQLHLVLFWLAAPIFFICAHFHICHSVKGIRSIRPGTHNPQLRVGFLICVVYSQQGIAQVVQKSGVQFRYLDGQHLTVRFH